MQRVALVSFLALSLSVLNASAANAFGTKALFNRLDPTENGDFTDLAPFLDALLSTQDSVADLTQSAASDFVNDVVAPVAEAVGLANLSEGFENVSSLSASGWAFINNSNPAPLSPATWTQGVTATSNFPAQSGPTNSFAQVGSTSTNAITGGQVSNWLITPELDFSGGGVVSFFALTFGGNSRPEFIEVRQSGAGASTNVGTTATDVGDFTTLTGSAGGLTQDFVAPAPGAIPGYAPLTAGTTWRQYSFNVAPTGGSGRLAFRYFATDSGVDGTQAQYVAIDTVNFAVPEPATSSLAGFAALGLASYFKGKRKRNTA